MAVATENGVEFEEIRYTKNPPDEATLRELIAKLEDPVENLVRKDSQFKKLELNEDDYVGNVDAVVEVLLRYPRLLQRPVIVTEDKAEALKLLKTHKGSRFRPFSSREEAEAFAREELETETKDESQEEEGKKAKKPDEGCPFKGEIMKFQAVLTKI